MKIEVAAICGRIQQARETAGYTQKTFAAVMGGTTHERTIQSWEIGEIRKGERRWTVPLKHLDRIAELTGTTVEWLLFGDTLLARVARLEQRLARVEARRAGSGRTRQRA